MLLENEAINLLNSTPSLAFVQTQAFLWFKSVEAANKEAEEQDRRDGYL